MKQLNFITVIFMLTLVATACFPQNQTFHYYGGSDIDYAEALIQNNLGEFVIAGGTKSYSSGQYSLLLAKFVKHTETPDWALVIGGSQKDYAFSAIRTPSSYYAMTGLTYSYSTGDPLCCDLIVAKVDNDGNPLWTRSTGGTYNDIGYSIFQTYPDFGFVVAGMSESYPFNDSTDFLNIFVVKYNLLGDLEWARSIGGIHDDDAHSIIQTSDGGYALTGFTRSYGAGIPGNANLIFVKLNSSGIVQWSKVINGATGNDRGHQVLETPDGGYIITGVTWSFGAGAGDLILLKFNSSGNLEWARTAGGSGIEYGRSIVIMPDSSYVVSGVTNSYGAGGNDVFILKFSPSGNFLWATTVGGTGDDEGNSIVRTKYGEFAVAGGTKSFGLTSEKVSLIKANFEGRTCLGDTVSPEIRYVSPIISSPVILEREVFPHSNVVTPSLASASLSHTTACNRGEDHLAILVNTCNEPITYKEIKKAYQTCLDRHFKKENIYVLHHINTLDLDGDSRNDVNGLATLDNLKEAIEEWAAYRNDDLTTLYIYFTGHANVDYYPMLNFTNLNPTLLDSMLTLYSSVNSAKNIYIVHTSCFSGSFIDELSDSGRIVMTSTNDSLSAWFKRDGSFSFGLLIWNKFALGYSFKLTFNWIASLVKEIWGDAKQIPLFDDDGNGVGHREPLPNGGDGDIGEWIGWGPGIASRSPMDAPEIEEFTLEEVGDSVYFQITTSMPVDSCWVFIVRQDTTYVVPEGESPAIDIPTIMLSPATPLEYVGAIYRGDYRGEYKFVGLTIAPPTGMHLVGDYSYPVSADTILALGMIENVISPDRYVLTVEPNPFNLACRISSPANAKVEIFDVNGRAIATLDCGDQIWKPEPSVGSGIYLVRAKVGEQEVTKRVVYLK